MTDNHTYGIWIPGQGWLKGKDVFADTSLDKARQVAYLIGRNAQVRFIDEAIVDLERLYLEQEQRSWINTLKKLFTRSLRKSKAK